jgi:hypothetical protein
MGNSSSTPTTSSAPTSAPSKKRSRDSEDEGHTESEPVDQRGQKKTRAIKQTSEVATGRLLVKNCRVWNWLDDGLTLSEPHVTGVHSIDTKTSCHFKLTHRIHLLGLKFIPFVSSL